MSTTSSNPNQDEKKTPGPNPDEQFASFWKKYGLILILALLLVFAVVLGRAIYGYVKEQKNAEVQEAYAAVKSELELRDFVHNYKNHPLVGAAQLRLADIAYQNRNYEVAADAYSKAAPLLKDSPVLGERAQLGQGISLLQQDKVADGEKILKSLLGNLNTSPSIRTDAGYNLTLQAIKDGRNEEARTIGTQVLAIENAGSAAQRIVNLLNTLPEENK